MAVLESEDEPARLVCPGLLEYRFMQAGITPRLTVLYLPDYVTSTTRLSKTSALWLGLGRMLPEYDISVPLVAGPFSDDEGINAFFDRTRKPTAPKRARLDLKRDFLTSMAVVARAVKAHRPQLIMGDGQGAMIALGLSKPLGC